MIHLCWSLMWFEVILEPKINLDQSELIPIKRVDNMEELASKIGCKVGQLPSTYLGTPLDVLLNQGQHGINWKSGFVKDKQCGKDKTSPKGEGLI